MWQNTYWSPGKGSELAENYKWLIVGSSFVYLPMIYGLQWIMKSRTAYQLKWEAFSWNMMLSLLSFFGALLMLNDDWRILRLAVVPEVDYMPNTRMAIAVFALTKTVEFGDTVFLILKKKPLIFLHVYHHFTVALYCWHAQKVNVSFAHHFAFINLCIHAVMYFYYAMAIVVPRHGLLRAFRPYITMSQTLQMFVGMCLSWNAISCGTLPYDHVKNAWTALIMYTSYAYLFTLFYFENYVRGVRPRMTILIGTIHILAAVGASMLWHDERAARLSCEVLTGYCVTAVLFWFAKQRATKLPMSSSGSAVDGKLKLFESTPEVKGASLMQSIGRVLLMLSNCWGCWAHEHRVFKLRYDRTIVEQKKREAEAKKVTQVAKVSERKSSKKALQLPASNRRRCGCGASVSRELLEEQMSFIYGIIENPDTQGLTSIKAPQTQAVVRPTVSAPAAQPFDTWFAFMCCSLPAIYTANVYGDLILGVCVHGCLRWVLELHTTGLLVKNMRIAKFNYSEPEKEKEQ